MRLASITAAVLAVVTASVALPSVADDGGPLVTGDWLRDRLGGATLAILDIRDEPEGAGRAAFAEAHIPGAVYSSYDADGWRREVDGVIGMLPPTGEIEGLIGSLGIDNGDHVVIVADGTSSSDFGSATRIYWTFKVLGHDAVSILDGGWASWTADVGNPVESGAADVEPARFVADFRPELVAGREDVARIIEAGSADLVDARPVAQYSGAQKAGPVARPGTLPTAMSLPQDSLVEAGTGGRAVSGDRLQALLARHGVTDDTPQVAFCNTGHWASIAWFALSELAGHDDVRLYDGSMVDWAADPARPLVLGGGG